MDGYNSVIFAYGQNASGKTFTLVCSCNLPFKSEWKPRRTGYYSSSDEGRFFLHPVYTCKRMPPPMLILRDMIYHLFSYVFLPLILFLILFLIHVVDRPDSNKAIVRVNVFRQHPGDGKYLIFIRPKRQFWNFIIIHPTSRRAGFRPGRTGHYRWSSSYPHRNLMGPYLVFVASTINGYECTGRSLSTTTLWSISPSLTKDSAPGNQPNDLQLMSDAPAHHLFVLLPQ